MKKKPNHYTDESAMKMLEKYMKDPRTQAKAAVVLQQMVDIKESDAEAMAIAIMIVETVKGLPREGETKE